MTSLFKTICRILVLAMLSASFQMATAGIIGTDKAAAAQSDRATVLAALSRSDVQTQLQAQGLDPKQATERVAAMTDEEVRTLAGSINSAPAGATSGWAVAIIIALIVWFVWYRK